MMKAGCYNGWPAAGAGYARSKYRVLRVWSDARNSNVVAVSGGKLILANHPLDSIAIPHAVTRTGPVEGFRVATFDALGHGFHRRSMGDWGSRAD